MSEKKETKAPKKAKKEKKVEATQAELNIGMIGHVDHGKTSLTQTLTGKWTDTHSEELKRGISIRLGYADITFYKCAKCNEGTFYINKEICPICGKKAKKLRTVSFVDAPGHETLMATMLSGAALMHGAVLVIAANEKCPQPQTEEHLTALKIAGVKNLVVAQNKIDLVDKEEALKSMKAINDFLEKNRYKDVPIIPVAAHFGTNIDLLIETIEKSIPTPKFDLKKPLLMHCARSFDINKPGEKLEKLKGGVLGGSILQGKVKEGDNILISPGPNGKPIETTVVSVSCASGPIKEAHAGGLIAIGTLLDPVITQNDKMRGQVIGLPGKVSKPVTRLDLKVEQVERAVGTKSANIKTNETIVLTVGTMPAVGTVTKYANNSMTVALNNSVVVEKGQKIALSKREATRWRLVAFGIVQ
ncbi:MAG: translation initiation factor IF-2 subunit gamma [Candidatus Diapherotrites archaeon]|uniref:protein-synthesizing GTPase n=1 Tax=Candidatus Iainarchaeum sp. TaxID=3101447 RepID=A0A2D6M0K9_9ARCH|nr:translation initiation factor IF-2 subunit gamma [Candidatus Diapherotrites archaeon]